MCIGMELAVLLGVTFGTCHDLALRLVPRALEFMKEISPGAPFYPLGKGPLKGGCSCPSGVLGSLWPRTQTGTKERSEFL